MQENKKIMDLVEKLKSCNENQLDFLMGVVATIDYMNQRKA